MFESPSGLVINGEPPWDWPDETVSDLAVDDPAENYPAEDDFSAAGPQAPELPNPADIAPSGMYALELDYATRHPETLTAAEKIDAAVGFDRLAAWAIARQQAVLAPLARHPNDGSIRLTTSGPTVTNADRRAWAADEIALALTLAPGAAATRMAHAQRADTVLRPTRDLLEAGKICPARARLIADMLTEYDDEITAAVQDRVLPRAPEQTVAQLRAALTRAITAVVPDPAQRHQKARKQRRVDLWPGQDGMATLSACLTATEATASYEWISRLARGLPCPPGPDGSPGQRQSIDVRRADVLSALLTGRLIASVSTTTVPTTTVPTTTVPTDTAATGSLTESATGTTTDLATGLSSDTKRTPAESAGVALTPEAGPGQDPTDNPPLVAAPVSAHRPLIHVTVPVTTLMSLDDEPGELAGYGPIPAPIARQIAADPTSVWRRLLTDPVSGTLLDYGRTTYRPPAALAGFVRARDSECRFPTCRRTAARCELDHVQPWAHDGTTSEDNLCALCEHHHDTKEQIGWQVVLHPDRRMEWITPTGHHYWSAPVDHRPYRPPTAADLPHHSAHHPRHDPPADLQQPTPIPRPQSFEELWSVAPPDPADPPPF